MAETSEYRAWGSVSRWSMQIAKSRQQASGLASCASHSSFAYFEWPLTPSCTLLNIWATLRRGLPFFLAMFGYCYTSQKILHSWAHPLTARNSGAHASRLYSAQFQSPPRQNHRDSVPCAALLFLPRSNPFGRGGGRIRLQGKSGSLFGLDRSARLA